jgi:two-component system, response regulator YesN
MYKVLLVDDEHYDLEGLKQLIPWPDLRLHMVDAVHSGVQALSVIEQIGELDVLITDVMMPRMSGLELAMAVKERFPNIKIVFLSGYQEFEFARKAIELSAAGYVLKPMNDEDLIRVLNGVVQQLDREKQDRQLEHMSQGELLYQWLEDLVPDDQKRTILSRLYVSSPSGAGYRSAVIEIDDVQWKLNRYAARERDHKIHETIRTIKQLVAERADVRFCRLGRYQVVLVFPGTHDEREWLDGIRQAAPRSAGLTVTIAIGRRVDQFAHIIHSYHESKDLLGYKLFLGKNRLITEADTQHLSDRKINDLDAVLQQMFAAMTNHELPLMESYLQQAFSFAYQFQHKFTAQNFAMHIISRLEAYLQRTNQSLYSLLGIQFKDLDILLQFETIDDIQRWLRSKLLEISDLIQAKRQKRHTKLIEEIERCIDEQMSDKATLREVARRFSFSPNYLSHIFKEETGERFSNYMVRKRLDKACELLRTTNLKIFEISDMLGYSTVTYFSRQFRNAYGMTPGDYRRQSESTPNRLEELSS